MKKSIDMSLEELALLDDEEARQAIINSKLNSSGSYLELRFRDLQQHFGYPGLDVARLSVFECQAPGLFSSACAKFIFQFSDQRVSC